MRQIIIDTETTGLDPKQGHRIIELAAIEVVNRRATGRSIHFHVDPERDIDVAATEVHGRTWDDLKGKPKFGDVAPEFLDFARGAEWVIHNAPFDIAFLDDELTRAGLPACGSVYASLVDTLTLARETFPGKRNSLDALCERFTIDHAHRTLHGALLDAQLLAEVWLAMTRGQDSLTIDIATPARGGRGDRRRIDRHSGRADRLSAVGRRARRARRVPRRARSRRRRALRVARAATRAGRSARAAAGGLRTGSDPASRSLPRDTACRSRL